MYMTHATTYQMAAEVESGLFSDTIKVVLRSHDFLRVEPAIVAIIGMDLHDAITLRDQLNAAIANAEACIAQCGAADAAAEVKEVEAELKQIVGVK